MMLGADVVVLSIEDARNIDRVVAENWSLAKMKRLQKDGTFDAVAALREVIRDYDRREREK